MIHLLLIIIYLGFISLGLPDSLLGSAWPTIYKDINVPISYSGIVFIVISVGTVISSLNSDRLIKKFGTGKVTAFSTLTTVIALLGFSFSKSFIALCLWAIPYGLGAGSIDTALNNYVATHYASRHMSWLHCMWGVGASIGPYIMSIALTYNQDWHFGYRYVAFIQAFLCAILFVTLSLWKKDDKKEEAINTPNTKKDVLSIIGVKGIIITFFCYCALEQTSGLWAASWLVNVRGIDEVSAARFASLFFTGITVGRAISGFITMKLNDKKMVWLGEGIIILGLLCLFQSFSNTLSLIGLVIIGLGCAPIYPSLIHSVPERFGEANSQSIIGMCVASAYVGTSAMAPLFGVILKIFDISLFPLYLLFIAIFMLLSNELSIRNKR